MKSGQDNTEEAAPQPTWWRRGGLFLDLAIGGCIIAWVCMTVTWYHGQVRANLAGTPDIQLIWRGVPPWRLLLSLFSLPLFSGILAVVRGRKLAFLSGWSIVLALLLIWLRCSSAGWRDTINLTQRSEEAGAFVYTRVGMSSADGGLEIFYRRSLTIPTWFNREALMRYHNTEPRSEFFWQRDRGAFGYYPYYRPDRPIAPSFWHDHGFDFDNSYPGAQNPFPTRRNVSFTAPHALWILIAGIAPGAWVCRCAFRATRPWRARRKGLCPCCGYDLRATPLRCPECGRKAP